jgi:hypothetical protein
VVQRLVVGALVKLRPLDEPQTPLVAVPSTGAEHEAFLPLLAPAQVQSHGPVPVTDDADPLVQRLLVGAVVTAVPFAEPHTPSMIR